MDIRVVLTLIPQENREPRQFFLHLWLKFGLSCPLPEWPKLTEKIDFSGTRNPLKSLASFNVNRNIVFF